MLLFPFLLTAVLLYHNWNKPAKLALSFVGLLSLGTAIFCFSEGNPAALVTAGVLVLVMTASLHFALMD